MISIDDYDGIEGIAVAKNSALLSHHTEYDSVWIVAKGTVVSIVGFELQGLWVRFHNDDTFWIPGGDDNWDVKWVGEMFDELTYDKIVIQYIDNVRRQGIFALKKIDQAELIGLIQGKFYTEQSLEKHYVKDDHLMNFGNGVYMHVNSPFRYTNHSCNPNAGIRRNFELCALKEIQPGEEITIDYDTIEWDWQMDCACGESNCRGKIKGFKYLSKELQEKYVANGIVMEYILKNYVHQQMKLL
jgi:hypothetical protein